MPFAENLLQNQSFDWPDGTPPQGVLSRYSQMTVVLKENLARILFTSISVVRESPESTITIFPSFLEKVQM